MQWPPWSKPREIPPPPVDVQAVARQTAAEVVRELLVNPATQRAVVPLLAGSGPARIYAYDHPERYWINQAPNRRPGSLVSVDTLRLLAESYDVLRACIQHHKREVHAVPGAPTPKDEKDKTAQKYVAEAQAFFDTPGGLGGVGRRRTHFESEVLEDVLVVGAAAVYFDIRAGGQLLQAEAIDASTIRPRVDAYGWPGPGEIAYEQWIHGVQVSTGYTQEQLLYDGLNPISYSPYFKSPIEWLVQVINAALRADQWNLGWLTDGNSPDQIITLPEDWTPDQIREYAAWWDGLLSGNSRQRRKTRFAPHGSQYMGQPSRKDQDFQEYELWTMRRTCGIMGVSPVAIGFGGEHYKQSQEGSLAVGSQIGSGQLLEFRKHLYDEVLRRLGYDFLEWVDITTEEDDAKTKAETNEILIRSGQKTPNEVRQAAGDKTLPAGNVLLVLNTLTALEQAIKPPEPPPSGAPGQDTPPAAQDGQEKPGDGFQLLGEQERVLRQWEKKALNRVRDNRSASCPFVAERLSDALSARVEAGLKLCDSAQSVRNLFENVIELSRASGDFDEEKHPRNKGKFAPKGGAGDEASESAGGSASGGKASGGSESTATVDASAKTRETANKYFGREVSDADFQQLMGAPSGAKVHVDARSDGGLIFHVEHPLFEQQHRAQCMKKSDGTPFMLLDLYHLKDEAPEGSGTRAFAQMVSKGRDMGLDAIVIPEAARTSRMVGYYVWPRLGADGPIPAEKVKELPDSLKGAEKLSDLMKTPEGRDWWKDKGQTVFCHFKLDQGSGSSQALSKYLADKGGKK